MLEIGQIFNKNGVEYCLLDILILDDKKYALFSLETDKLSFSFYEIIENETDYDLKFIDDQQLNFHLLELYEEKGEVNNGD